MSQLASAAVVSAVGLACKAFLNSGYCSITVNNLPILLDALGSERRLHRGQGLVTVSNHISTLDDPLTWGVLPFENFTDSRTWPGDYVLSASHSELRLWSESLFSSFLRKGQVIEVFRGDGIWQPALDEVIEKLNQGHWLHMFGEGKVHQPTAYSQTDGTAHLLRFKWGVGRIIMETNVPPLIIPMWLTGFDKLMPEHRPFPYKFLPKRGARLGVTFGDPLPPENIIAALIAQRKTKHSSLSDTAEGYTQGGRPVSGPELPSALHPEGWLENTINLVGRDIVADPEGARRRAQLDDVRSEVTAIIQRAVEDLGRRVSGNNLDLPLSEDRF